MKLDILAISNQILAIGILKLELRKRSVVDLYDAAIRKI